MEANFTGLRVVILSPFQNSFRAYANEPKPVFSTPNLALNRTGRYVSSSSVRAIAAGRLA